MPDLRECLGLQREAINSLLREFGCLTPVGGLVYEDSALLIGQQGQAHKPASLMLRAVGRRMEILESWWFDDDRGLIVPATYRYALYEGESEELARWELHPLQPGRTREIYGLDEFPHLHVRGAKEHMPTGMVCVEAALRFAVAEGTDLGEDEARRVVSLTRESEHDAREWRG